MIGLLLANALFFAIGAGLLPLLRIAPDRASLVEIPAQRIVFATDYPQEIRDTAKVRDFVDGIRALGGAGQEILSGNVGLLLPRLARAA